MVSLQVGKIALESTIPYPDTLHYEIGNWKVDAQRQPMEGAIHELYLLNQPATAKEIATRFNEKNGYFPPPGPEPKRLAIGYGPFVDWTSRSSVQISWNMDFETFTHIDLLGPEGEFREFRAASATKKHQVHFDELKPDAEYRFEFTVHQRGIMLNSAASSPLTVLFIMRRLSYVRQPKLPLLPSPTSR